MKLGCRNPNPNPSPNPSPNQARTRFTLVLSATRPADATNWLQLVQDPPEAMFIVRQTFGRRTEEVAASLSIVLRGEGGGIGGGTPLTPKRLDDGLQSASVLVAGASAMFAKWAYGFQARARARARARASVKVR